MAQDLELLSKTDLVYHLKECQSYRRLTEYHLEEARKKIEELEAELKERKNLKRDIELEECINRLEVQKTPYKIFDLNFQIFTQVVKTTGFYDGFDVKSWVLNPTNRFVLKGNPKESLIMSEAFSVLMKAASGNENSSESNRAVLESARQKQQENADEFAIRMYSVILALRREEKISTYRDTVNSLNNNKIQTYRPNGKWHLGTLQNLKKRWEKLGLTPPMP